MKNNTKRIVRNYQIFKIAVFVTLCIALFIVLIVIMDVSSNPFLLILVLPTFCFINYNIYKFYFQKHVYGILEKECDAVKFGDVINLIGKKAHWTVRAEAKIGLGEYESAIILWKSWYACIKKIDLKFIILNNLAVFYFEMRDFDNLQIILSEVENLKKPNYKIKPIIKSNLELFESFLNKDFNRCFYILKKRLPDNSKLVNSRRKLFAAKLKYAIVCYESGDCEKSKECFLYIIENAPKLLGYKYIAQKYIEAINKNDSQILNSLDFGPAIYDIELEISERKKEIVIQYILTISIAIVGILYVFFVF